MLILKALRHYLPGALLLTTQAALACAVCILSLSVIRDSQSRLGARVSGDAERIWIVHAADPVGKQASPETIREDLALLSRLAGVQTAAAADAIPFGGRSRRYGLCNSAKAMEDAISAGSIEVTGCQQPPIITATERWLPSMGIPVLQGRDADPAEVATGARVILLSQALARVLYANEPAVGRQVYLGPDDVRTVIGVFDAVAGPSPMGSAADAQWAVQPGYPGGSQRYFAMHARPGLGRQVVDGAIDGLYGLEAYRMLDPEKARSLVEYRDEFLRADTFKARLLGAITVLVLVIMMVGVSGMVGSWINRRRRAIGIRRALGARQRDILSYFLVENLLLSAPGAILGLGLAAAITHFSRFEALSSWGAGTAAIAVSVVMATNVLACLQPSLRAARQEPLELLRAR